MGIFGPIEAAHLTLPVYSLVRMISIGNFLERIEAIMVAVWIGLIFIKKCVSFFICRCTWYWAMASFKKND
ncbi:hypothetical protein GCM10020331_071010 [Ectobacillus funiculus]